MEGRRRFVGRWLVGTASRRLRSSSIPASSARTIWTISWSRRALPRSRDAEAPGRMAQPVPAERTVADSPLHLVAGHPKLLRCLPERQSGF